MRSRVFALGAAFVLASVAVAQGSAQSRTTAPPTVIPIKVTMTDTAFRVSPKAVPRATMGRFILVNRGTKPHAFTLGTTAHGTRGQTGFTRTLKPNEQKIFVLFLDYRGLIPYHGSLPADKTNARMKGFFKVF